MKEEMKTINEWATQDGIIIIDPDGFDRSDPNLMAKKISYKDFCKGILRCSICMPAKGVEVKVTNN